MPSHVVGHLVRRGAEYLASDTYSQEYIDQLKKDAQLYENAGPGMEVKPSELFAVFYIALLVLVIVSSIQYTIGHVITSLATIETPTSSLATVIKYSDEPDVPLEKAPLMSDDVDVEIEVRATHSKPVTNRIRSATARLRQVGGLFAQWRGLPVFVLYHFLQSMFTSFFVFNLGVGIVGQLLASLFVSIALARVHMLWTHNVIGYPSAKSWYSRMPARKDCRALFLPTLVHAAAKQITVLVPVAVAYAVGLAGPNAMVEPQNPQEAVFLGVRVMAPLIAYASIALNLLLPTSIVLKRIEAICLPQGEEAIVSFDREALVGDLDLTAKGASRALFKRVWKSVDSVVIWNVIKIHIKKVLIQTAVVLFGLLFILAQLAMIGGDRLYIFSKSASAQLQLMVIEAAQKQQ